MVDWIRQSLEKTLHTPHPTRLPSADPTHCHPPLSSISSILSAPLSPPCTIYICVMCVAALPQISFSPTPTLQRQHTHFGDIVYVTMPFVSSQHLKKKESRHCELFKDGVECVLFIPPSPVSLKFAVSTTNPHLCI